MRCNVRDSSLVMLSTDTVINFAASLSSRKAAESSSVVGPLMDIVIWLFLSSSLAIYPTQFVGGFLICE